MRAKIILKATYMVKKIHEDWKSYSISFLPNRFSTVESNVIDNHENDKSKCWDSNTF